MPTPTSTVASISSPDAYLAWARERVDRAQGAFDHAASDPIATDAAEARYYRTAFELHSAQACYAIAVDRVARGLSGPLVPQLGV